MRRPIVGLNSNYNYNYTFGSSGARSESKLGRYLVSGCLWAGGFHIIVNSQYD